MILTIDMGNTTISFGAYDGDELKFVARMYTSRQKSSDEFAINIKDFLSLYNVKADDFEGAIMASVVPELTDRIVRAVMKTLGITPLLVGADHNGGLKIDILPVEQLGADLVAGSIGAINKYPLPCLIADLGTATKILVIDEKGKFLGCTISPGVKISLDALAQGAALLPSISLTKPDKAIGEHTTECMQSGIVYGTAAMLDGLIGRIKKEAGFNDCTVVATGGYSAGIIPCCEEKILYDKHLVLNGLLEIYKSGK